jgi:hypothetical protein
MQDIRDTITISSLESQIKDSKTMKNVELKSGNSLKPRSGIFTQIYGFLSGTNIVSNYSTNTKYIGGDEMRTI